MPAFPTREKIIQDTGQEGKVAEERDLDHARRAFAKI